MDGEQDGDVVVSTALVLLLSTKPRSLILVDLEKPQEEKRIRSLALAAQLHVGNDLMVPEQQRSRWHANGRGRLLWMTWQPA